MRRNLRKVKQSFDWKIEALVEKPAIIELNLRKHTVEKVYYNGKLIGTLQVDDQGNCISVCVDPKKGSRRGRDIKWLINQYEKDNWLKENDRLKERQETLRKRRGGKL